MYERNIMSEFRIIEEFPSSEYIVINDIEHYEFLDENFKQYSPTDLKEMKLFCYDIAKKQHEDTFDDTLRGRKIRNEVDEIGLSNIEKKVHEITGK